MRNHRRWAAALIAAALAFVLSSGARDCAAVPPPGPPPVYHGWRPYWGGLHGWGYQFGANTYPAYTADKPPYRFGPLGYPPIADATWYPYQSTGEMRYPRTFGYVW